jgi:hypothetical protein
LRGLGWFQVVVSGFEWFWMILAGDGWYEAVSGRFGWFWVALGGIRSVSHRGNGFRVVLWW